MGEGVIADLVTFVVHALHDAYIVLGDLADHEEGALDAVLVQDVEDARGPDWVGAVVEGDGDLFGLVGVVLDRVGQGVRLHGLARDHLRVHGNLVVVVEREGALAVLRLAGDAHDVAGAFVVDVVAGGDGGEILAGVGPGGRVPDLPQGVVLGAELPEREGLQAEGAGGAHLVQDGDGVQEPDLVTIAGVLVNVAEMRVERVGVELDGGAGVRGSLPRFLGGDGE